MAQTMGDPSHLITNYKLLITNLRIKNYGFLDFIVLWMAVMIFWSSSQSLSSELLCGSDMYPLSLKSLIQYCVSRASLYEMDILAIFKD
jgi:hypothetical protein